MKHIENMVYKFYLVRQDRDSLGTFSIGKTQKINTRVGGQISILYTADIRSVFKGI